LNEDLVAIPCVLPPSGSGEKKPEDSLLRLDGEVNSDIFT
jgi:hypothetical protein